MSSTFPPASHVIRPTAASRYDSGMRHAPQETASVASRGGAPTSGVTVVISVYNQRAFVEEAVASALQQTVQAFVHVVDDGSTDGSAEAARALGVPVTTLPHRGSFDTFRSGLARVDTPYFSLVGGDDVLNPRFIELTLPHMADPAVAFVYTGMEWFGSEHRLVPARPFSPGRLLWNNYVPAASLTRTEAYRMVGGLDPLFASGAEDWALWVAMVANGWKGVPVDEPLLRYRRHGGGSRSSNRRYWAGQRIRLNLIRRHPLLYLRHAPRIAAVAAERALARLAGRASPL